MARGFGFIDEAVVDEMGQEVGRPVNTHFTIAVRLFLWAVICFGVFHPYHVRINLVLRFPEDIVTFTLLYLVVSGSVILRPYALILCLILCLITSALRR